MEKYSKEELYYNINDNLLRIENSKELYIKNYDTINKYFTEFLIKDNIYFKFFYRSIKHNPDYADLRFVLYYRVKFTFPRDINLKFLSTFKESINSNYKYILNESLKDKPYKDIKSQNKRMTNLIFCYIMYMINDNSEHSDFDIENKGEYYYNLIDTVLDSEPNNTNYVFYYKILDYIHYIFSYSFLQHILDDAMYYQLKGLNNHISENIEILKKYENILKRISPKLNKETIIYNGRLAIEDICNEWHYKNNKHYNHHTGYMEYWKYNGFEDMMEIIPTDEYIQEDVIGYLNFVFDILSTDTFKSPLVKDSKDIFLRKL